jgi:hypothetical protein
LSDLTFIIDSARHEDRDAGRPGQVVLKKLARALEEFLTYVDSNAAGIVNYGERYRCGERISTGFVESTINQVVAKRFVKKQQMRWTPRGAHLLLQVRVQELNGDLRSAFQRWYPRMALCNDEQRDAYNPQEMDALQIVERSVSHVPYGGTAQRRDNEATGQPG